LEKRIDWSRTKNGLIGVRGLELEERFDCDWGS
jgi:hypothetical protein